MFLKSFKERIISLIANKKNCFFFQKINTAIFYVYIACIPLTYFDWGSTKSYTFVLPFFVSLVGFFASSIYFLLFDKKRIINNAILPIVCTYIFLLLSSFINAFFIDKESVTFFGVNPFLVTLKETVYIGHAIMLIIYSYANVSLLNEKPFVVSFLIGFSLFVFAGLCQMFTILNIKPFGYVIDFLSKIKLSHPASYFVRYQKTCATCPEGAHMTQIAFCYLIPISAIIIINCQNKLLRIFISILLLCIIPISFFSTSAEFFATLIFSIFVIGLGLVIFFIKRKKIGMIIFVLISVAAVMAVVLSSNYFKVVVFEKLFGQESYSVQKRTSHIYNALIVFLKNPGFGVGSGLGGFYYKNNISNTWFVNSNEVRSLLIKSDYGVPTFAPFIPYFLSSYGLFGTVLFFGSFKKMFINIFNKRSLNMNTNVCAIKKVNCF